MHATDPAVHPVKRDVVRGAVEDAAWSYADPLESMLKARAHVCFDASKVEVVELARDARPRR